MLTFNTDGTIDCVLLDADGADLTVSLRRPDVDEFFGLWAAIDRLIAAQQATIAERGAPPEAPDGDADDATSAAYTDAVNAYTARSRETTRSLLRMNADLLREVIALLAPGGMPDGARLPSWATQSTIPNALLTHWQERPLDRGSSPTTQA